MLVTKRIICLANSRKPDGRCIAGIEVKNGHAQGWIRPVSDRPGGAVSEHERQYEDGSDPRVLDVLDVPLLAACPKDYQQENWYLDPKKYWVRRGIVSWGDLAPFAEAGGLWVNGDHTRAGLNDQISLGQANILTTSLKLIHIDGMMLDVFAPGALYGDPKRRVQAQFRFAGVEYALWVTDPGIERTYKAKGEGTYPYGECYLTISLGNAFRDSCHKLVAAVIPRS